MSAGKAARYQASLTNQTSHFAIMGGLGASIGDRARGRSRGGGGGVPSIRRRNTLITPYAPDVSLPFMRRNNLLSVNPAGSGGVGKRSLIIGRQGAFNGRIFL